MMSLELNMTDNDLISVNLRNKFQLPPTYVSHLEAG